MSQKTKNNALLKIDVPYLHVYRILSFQKISQEDSTNYHEKLSQKIFHNIRTPDTVKSVMIHLHQILQSSLIGDTISIRVSDPYFGQDDIYLATILYSEELEKKMLRIDFREFKYPFLTDYLSLYRIIFRLDIKKWERNFGKLIESIPDVDYPLPGKIYQIQHLRHPLMKKN